MTVLHDTPNSPREAAPIILTPRQLAALGKVASQAVSRAPSGRWEVGGSNATAGVAGILNGLAFLGLITDATDRDFSMKSRPTAKGEALLTDAALAVTR